MLFWKLSVKGSIEIGVLQDFWEEEGVLWCGHESCPLDTGRVQHGTRESRSEVRTRVVSNGHESCLDSRHGSCPLDTGRVQDLSQN